jgi:dTDP-L-rhamnose 4-epimerase
MYDIRDYTDVNNVGTSVLLEEIVRRSVEKQVAGSSLPSTECFSLRNI